MYGNILHMIFTPDKLRFNLNELFSFMCTMLYENKNDTLKNEYKHCQL